MHRSSKVSSSGGESSSRTTLTIDRQSGTVGSGAQHSLFMKVFMPIIWWEPFVLEVLVGVALLLFPNMIFVASYIVPTALMEAILRTYSASIHLIHPTTTSTTTTTGTSTGSFTAEPKLTTSIFPSAFLNENVFLIRSCGVMLIAAGLVHHLLLRACYYDMAKCNVKRLIERVPLFHWTMLSLLAMDTLRLVISWSFINQQFERLISNYKTEAFLRGQTTEAPTMLDQIILGYGNAWWWMLTSFWNNLKGTVTEGQSVMSVSLSTMFVIATMISVSMFVLRATYLYLFSKSITLSMLLSTQGGTTSTEEQERISSLDEKTGGVVGETLETTIAE